jgi:hypothetical protein
VNRIIRLVLGGVLATVLYLAISAISIVSGGFFGWLIFSAYNTIMGTSLNVMLGAAVGSIVSLYASTVIAADE